MTQLTEGGTKLQVQQATVVCEDWGKQKKLS